MRFKFLYIILLSSLLTIQLRADSWLWYIASGIAGTAVGAYAAIRICYNKPWFACNLFYTYGKRPKSKTPDTHLVYQITEKSVQWKLGLIPQVKTKHHMTRTFDSKQLENINAQTDPHLINTLSQARRSNTEGPIQIPNFIIVTPPSNDEEKREAMQKILESKLAAHQSYPKKPINHSN